MGYDLTHLELVLAGLSSGAGVEEIDCENLNNRETVSAATLRFDIMSATLDALEMNS